MNDETSRAPAAPGATHTLTADGRMVQGEPIDVGAVLARIETDLADVRERVMGHQPLTNAKDRIDAAHKRLNETQVRVADLEEKMAQADRRIAEIAAGEVAKYLEAQNTVPEGSTFEATGPVVDVTAAREAEQHGDAPTRSDLLLTIGRANDRVAELEDTVERLRKERNDALADAMKAKAAKPPDTWQPFQSEVEARDKRIAELEAERDVIVRERDNARAERDAAWRERDNKALALGQTESALTAAEDERDAARKLLANAEAERDQAVSNAEAERRMKEAAWDDAKQLRERLVQIANISDAPPF